MEKDKEVKLLIRCPKCKFENYSMAVITGVCNWCGYRGVDDPKFKGQ